MPGVLPTFTISGGTNQPWGVKSVILYIYNSYPHIKFAKKKFALGGTFPPLTPLESMTEKTYIISNAV